MKRMIAVFLLATGFMFANAQGVPTEVKTTFEKTHPNSKVDWKFENGVWNAYYTDTKTTTIRTEGYDKNGKKVYDRTQVSSKDVPTGVRTYYTTNYPAAKEYMVWSEAEESGTIKYYSDYEGKRYYFNDKGAFIESRPLHPVK
jgi:hypothetical protein